MRVGIVVPYVKRILGNRCAFTLARALAERHESIVFVDTLLDRLEPELRTLLGDASLNVVRRTENPAFRMRSVLAQQLFRGRDRAVARSLRREHERQPLDVVLVAANEGHWIAEYVQSWGPHRPRTAVWIYDLIDQVFLLGHRRQHPTARRALSSLYPALHAMERGRLAAFDLRFGLSDWTTQLVSFLYGLPIWTLPAAVDSDRFQPQPSAAPPAEYVAVPTSSLDRRLIGLIQETHAEGIPMIGYGPTPVPGIDHRGFVDDATMVRLLSDARATLFLFDYEAFGLVPFESLSCGTPVVTLPQEGPWAELRTNVDVRFGRDAPTLARACTEFLDRPRSAESTNRTRQSVMAHSPRAVADAFLREVTLVEGTRSPRATHR